MIFSAFNDVHTYNHPLARESFAGVIEVDTRPTIKLFDERGRGTEIRIRVDAIGSDGRCREWHEVTSAAAAAVVAVLGDPMERVALALTSDLPWWLHITGISHPDESIGAEFE